MYKINTRGSKFLSPAIFLITMVSLLSVFSMLFDHSQITAQVNETIIPLFNTDDVGNWTTYANSIYGIKMKHPANWIMESRSSNTFVFTPPYDEQSIKYPPELNIKIKTSYNYLLSDYVFHNLNYYIAKYLLGDFKFLNINNLNANISIAGLPAYKLTYQATLNNNYSSPISVTEFITKKDNNIYDLAFTAEGYNLNKYDKVLEKIVGSLEIF
jgi:hypothetical protein